MREVAGRRLGLGCAMLLCIRNARMSCPDITVLTGTHGSTVCIFAVHLPITGSTVATIIITVIIVVVVTAIMVVCQEVSCVRLSSRARSRKVDAKRTRLLDEGIMFAAPAEHQPIARISAMVYIAMRAHVRTAPHQHTGVLTPLRHGLDERGLVLGFRVDAFAVAARTPTHPEPGRPRTHPR